MTACVARLAGELGAVLGEGMAALVPGTPARLRVTPDAWVEAHAHLRGLRERPFRLLADLWGSDLEGTGAEGPEGGRLLLSSHLVAPDALLEQAAPTDIRIDTVLDPDRPEAPSLAGMFRNADWYEREAFDMLGIRFTGRQARRLLMPGWWDGHPLRKAQPGRATDSPPFELTPAFLAREAEESRPDPERLGLPGTRDGQELMVLNFGPHHPSAHGVFRIILGLDGEEIVWAVPDIGYHHRGVEKIAERQTWHSFIPYCDRVDYLGGVIHELPYLAAVERLCGIAVPPRAQVIRVMLAELYRVLSHLLFLGTMAQDIGQMSPVFYMFTDRERIHAFLERVTGARMHPAFGRIGGVALDLPDGWADDLRALLAWLRPRIDGYGPMVLGSELFRARTRGVGAFDTATALDWGVTGPQLRAAGCALDWRRCTADLPYGSFDFEVPVGGRGDCFDRTLVRFEEMRQSLGIVAQCIEAMPGGPVIADHPLAFPPPRPAMLADIDTLIPHFLAASHGPRVPPGAATGQYESQRGLIQYTLLSDGGPISCRTRIRTPSFAHLQQLSALLPGMGIADAVATIAAVDFVMSDVDR
jgi:NADH-quinone oxidoreductase subunit C/D